MKIKYGNMTKKKCDALVVTTNGFVTSSHNAVMGRGIAASISREYPEIKRRLGRHLLKNNNVVGKFRLGKKTIVSFPVKGVNLLCNKKKDNIVNHAQHLYKQGNIVPGFHCVANLRLIRVSCKALVKMADKHKWKRVIMPRPGCGAGELAWEDVMPILTHYLDDRFHVYTFKNNPHKVLITGSTSITSLTKKIYRKLNMCIAKDIQVILRDNNGADQLIQQYLDLIGYSNVTVYHTSKKPQNKNKMFKFNRVKIHKDKNRLRNMLVELQDSSIIIWDGKSKEEVKLFSKLEKLNKPCIVLPSNKRTYDSTKRELKSRKKKK